MWVLVSIMLGIPGHELPTSVLFFPTDSACEDFRSNLPRTDRIYYPDGHFVKVVLRDTCVPAYGDLDSVLHPKR